ncbi:exonuclease subunit SbcC [Pleurocapsa sp. PCC 7319]|uniref:exonuclease subunit SbcC n=1 Tax=Pleurocapsa sp. PCC 7319 TaxID=118161 RepID=UPI00034AF9B4|nr:exonuclease subunit SbcC [Pleurocapsa sp. PCC 7319]
MIPLQLTLKNFLSYRDATLNFRGLHTACICGANGAGKSSLLEAITWVIWGKSRAATEDDVIHGNAQNVRVDFEFRCNNQTYRIIRSRPRGRSSSLEFQVETKAGNFRSLTAKGLRATQEEIIACLKLDYDTFTNSAYLRQGRADEFMLRRPSERKQILADLLKLDRYEELAAKAKDAAKEYKGKIEQLKLNLEPLVVEIEQRKGIVAEFANLQQELTKLQKIQDSARSRLQQLQAIEYQRQTWEQQFNIQQTQHQNLTQDCDRAQKDINALTAELGSLDKLVNLEAEIVAKYDQLLDWQTQEKELSTKFVTHQEAHQQKQQLEKELEQQKNELNLQINQLQTQIEGINQQEQEITKILSKTDDVEIALVKLETSRKELKELDKIQQYISPLIKQKNNLQTQINREEAKLAAKLEQIHNSAKKLAEDIEKAPEQRKQLLTVDAQIEELDKKRIYQKRVEEKGTERKEFRYKLQENQRIYERQWQELQQKLQMLSNPDACCPLCDRELDDLHRHQVVGKTQQKQQEIQEQIWVIREQLSTCDRELQLLRQEYQAISQEISPYDFLQQQFGQLEAQLEASEEMYEQLQVAQEEKKHLELCLQNGNFAQELQDEIKQVEGELATLNYDEQTHALVRGEVNSLRWAEIKQAKIEDAKKRQAKLEQQKPPLIKKISDLQTTLEKLHINSTIQQKINLIEQQILELNYDRTIHQNLLTSLRQSQACQFRHQELQKAKQEYPQLKTKLVELEQLLQQRLQDKQSSQDKLQYHLAQRENIADNRQEIKALEQQIYQRRQQLDELISRSGRVQQSLTQIDSLKNQHQDTENQLKEYEKQYRIYQELTQAFGKNGIQALTIENILPQLEAKANQILARLTGNQFHVQFLTQRASKGTSKKKTKLIDTLDILIADAGGTRPYETYSGGEAFRINFSVRLALAKLLAQRSGTALQMLIVDEGFGTQDSEGCNRLVGAINAIASDFACILTVTHMPQFKEAFQTRIEVYKGDKGSSLQVSN